MSKFPVVIANAQNFEQEVVDKSRTGYPVLVDFYSKTCGPCKVLMPTFDKIEREHVGYVVFAKFCMDEEADKNFAKELGIEKMPTIRLYDEGHVVAEMAGKIRMADIIDAINSLDYA